MPADIGDFDQYVEAWAEDLELLRQNGLLSESRFLDFARERGLKVWGVINGEPGDFHRRGWLKSDGKDLDRDLHFHPFRIYPLQQLLQAITASRWRSPDKATDAELAIITGLARKWNAIADLAILLEPLYWPRICGRLTMTLGMSEQDHKSKLELYRQRIVELLEGLDSGLWREAHSAVCRDAALIDRNAELYLLLRVANWEQRKRLEGHISGALWIRHMAEVIRRAFEDIRAEEWPEEDQAFGHWFAGARKRVFGSERPLDDVLGSKPYLAYDFGLFTGSAMRWYVEGETEYYAAREMLPEPQRFGIELVNLRGTIESGRGNTALSLGAMLKEDQALRRFSMISFDGDVAANIRVMRNLAQQDDIVGAVFVHRPDFEFSNFTIGELVEVASRLYDAQGFRGDAVRKADWTGINNGRTFEKKYVAASQSSMLKGEEWGRALALHATDHPRRPDNGEIRSLVLEIRAALHGWVSDYDAHRARFVIDPESFDQAERTGD